MARRSAVLLTALVATAFAVGVPSASASVEFGDKCSGRQAPLPKLTLVRADQIRHPSPRRSDEWRDHEGEFNVSIPVPVAIPQTVKVLRPVSGRRIRRQPGSDRQRAPGFELSRCENAGQARGKAGHSWASVQIRTH